MSRLSRFARFHGNRQQQLDVLRKRGWQVLTIKKAPVVVAFKASPVGISARAWQGNADNPAFDHLFRSVQSAEAFITDYIDRVAAAMASKAERKAATKAKRAALKASDYWSEGDVFYNSWGYDQTNIDWYQVVAVKAKSVLIRPIAKNYKETGFMSGNSQPRRNDFTGPALAKPLDENGRIAMRHGGASKWDGKPAHESHYA